MQSVVDELRPFLRPGRSPLECGLDVLSVEKQMAFLKDQGSLK